ncbi:hypothetical protein LDENG_00110680 [Lucifuga dentata]|nr:hypothetical protein LDENG_00110680 [Lucifuga dentata]
MFKPNKYSCIHVHTLPYSTDLLFWKFVVRLYCPFCLFEPNIFNFHTRNITDNYFSKHTTGTVN